MTYCNNGDGYSPQRKYLQFNDLIINGSEIKESTLNGGYKGETVPTSFSNGSYISFKANDLYSKEQTLTLNLSIDFSNFAYINQEQKFYNDYITMNTDHPGKLWAADGGDIIWAWAYVTEFSRPYQGTTPSIYELDLNLMLPEGVWHKADLFSTFAIPTTQCTLLNCLNVKNRCQEVNNCKTCLTAPILTDCEYNSCTCSRCFTCNDSICNLDYNKIYNSCNEFYQFTTDCQSGQQLYGDKTLGTQICQEDMDDEFISGKFYSYTVLDTSTWSLRINGNVSNPEITINDNHWAIKGDYPYGLTVNNRGEIYKYDECGNQAKQPISDLVLEQCDTFTMVIHHGYNTIEMFNDKCCPGACLFIQTDDITN